jgi:hypothetical protein
VEIRRLQKNLDLHFGTTIGYALNHPLLHFQLVLAAQQRPWVNFDRLDLDSESTKSQRNHYNGNQSRRRKDAGKRPRFWKALGRAIAAVLHPTHCNKRASVRPLLQDCEADPDG